jgi:hypothetical protein
MRATDDSLCIMKAAMTNTHSFSLLTTVPRNATNDGFDTSNQESGKANGQTTKTLLLWKLFQPRPNNRLRGGPTWHSDYQAASESRFVTAGSIISTRTLTTCLFQEKTILTFGKDTLRWASAGLKSPPSISTLHDPRITLRIAGIVLRSKSLLRTNLVQTLTAVVRARRKNLLTRRGRSLPRGIKILHMLKQSNFICARKVQQVLVCSGASTHVGGALSQCVSNL